MEKCHEKFFYYDKVFIFGLKYNRLKNRKYVWNCMRIRFKNKS